MPKKAKNSPTLTDDHINNAQIAAEYLHSVFRTDAGVSDWLSRRGFPISKTSIGEFRRGTGKLSVQFHDAIVHWANKHQEEQDKDKNTGTPFAAAPKPLLTHEGVLGHVRKAIEFIGKAEQHVLLASQEAGLPITSVGFLKLHDQLSNLRKTYLETILGREQ